MVCRFEPMESGTRVTLEHSGWGGLIGDPEELAGWFAGEVAAPLRQARHPQAWETGSRIDWSAVRRAHGPAQALSVSGLYW